MTFFLESVDRHFRVDRKEIAYLRFIVEAYDGLAVLTTILAADGRIRLTVAPGREGEFDELVQNLIAEEGLRIEPLTAATTMPH